MTGEEYSGDDGNDDNDDNDGIGGLTDEEFSGDDGNEEYYYSNTEESGDGYDAYDNEDNVTGTYADDDDNDGYYYWLYDFIPEHNPIYTIHVIW